MLIVNTRIIASALVVHNLEIKYREISRDSAFSNSHARWVSLPHVVLILKVFL